MRGKVEGGITLAGCAIEGGKILKPMISLEEGILLCP